MCWLIWQLFRMISPSSSKASAQLLRVANHNAALHEPLLVPGAQQSTVRAPPQLDVPNAWYAVDMRARRVMADAEARLVHAGVGTQFPAPGNYVGLYWQYGCAHPIPAQSLSFTPDTSASGTVMGNGNDVLPAAFQPVCVRPRAPGYSLACARAVPQDVGTFTVEGAYSLARLLLTKRYIPGTGDPRENQGHSVQLRLTYCNLEAALPDRVHELRSWGAPPAALGFYGTWHVRMLGCDSDDAEMCLWLPAVPVVVGYRIEKTDALEAEPIMGVYAGEPVLGTGGVPVA